MLSWDEFQKRKEAYNEVWLKLKEEFNGDLRDFLDKSYLVAAYDYGQVTFGYNSVSGIAMENQDFFIQNSRIEQLKKLIKEFNALKKLNPQQRTKIRKKLENFNTKGLLVKDFHAEIRFSVLKFAYIQEIKKSKYCDQTLMDMSTVSTRVILKIRGFER